MLLKTWNWRFRRLFEEKERAKRRGEFIDSTLLNYKDCMNEYKDLFYVFVISKLTKLLLVMVIQLCRSSDIWVFLPKIYEMS